MTEIDTGAGTPSTRVHRRLTATVATLGRLPEREMGSLPRSFG